MNESTQTIQQAGYMLAERWSDDEASLYNECAGSYELWRVATGAENALVMDTPNDGRDFIFVRELRV